MARDKLIKVRRGTAAAWTSANPTLAAGEPGLETDTGKFKWGDGTTAWASLAYAGGTGGSVTYGTPAIVLGTSAAAGSTDESIRRDATIVAFDATAPTTQAFGDSAATGSAAVAARRDHKHAMPAAPSDASISVSDVTTNNVTSSAHGFAPKSPADSTKFLDGSATPAWDTVKDSDLSTSDITTNDVSTSKHGFTPKAPNDTAKFLRGDGTWASVGGVTTVIATDVFWDAKGDLALGTGSDAAARLAAGSNGQVPIYDSSQTTGMKKDYPPGYEFDYVETTTTLTITATSDATAQTFISGSAVAYDGSTRVLIEVWAPYLDITQGQAAVMNLYDGSTDLGRIVNLQSIGASGSSGLTSETASGKRFLTPSAATHTYHIKAWKTGGTAHAGAQAGGTATYMPAFIRITKA